jgi:hypothetical protein
MSLNYQVEDIAQEVFVDLDEPTDISVGLIKFFIRGQVGNLNNLLGTSYQLNDSGNEITPQLGEDEKAVMKSLYIVHYYKGMVRRNLGASGFDAVIELSAEGGTVRKVNKNEVAKTYLQLANDERSNLKSLVNLYRMHHGTPNQVVGLDIYNSLGLDIDIRYSR